MSGPGFPALLAQAEPYREIKLLDRTYEVDPDDPEDKPYVKTVWARPCPEGWIGWHYKYMMTSSPQVIWLRGWYEEVE